MIRIAAVAVFALFVAALPPAAAQSQPPAPGGEPKNAAQKLDSGGPATSTQRRSRSTADARHCLQLATIVEIIRCAEKYR